MGELYLAAIDRACVLLISDLLRLMHCCGPVAGTSAAGGATGPAKSPRFRAALLQCCCLTVMATVIPSEDLSVDLEKDAGNTLD